MYLLIKSLVIEKIGMLDESFFCGFEDLVYCASAKKAGFKNIYVPSSIIWHKAGVSKRKLNNFPASNLVSSGAQYKEMARLLRVHFLPIVWIIPFLLHVSMIGRLILLISYGDWTSIKKAITLRFKKFFKMDMV